MKEFVLVYGWKRWFLIRWMSLCFWDLVLGVEVNGGEVERFNEVWFGSKDLFVFELFILFVVWGICDLVYIKSI